MEKMDDLIAQIDTTQKLINQKRPLKGKALASLREYYKIGLAWSSNALEGNTLTESETKVVIEDGLTIGGKPLKDHLEATGHAAAYDFMLGLVNVKSLKFEDMLSLHKLFYQQIDDQNAGVVRKEQVFISGSKYPVTTPANIESEMKAFVKALQEYRQNHHPVFTAAQCHKQFVFIHPFIDGNGRVARLLMNLILLQEGYSIAIIPPVLRAKYIACLEESHENDSSFIEFIANTVYETQKDYLRMLG